MSPPKGEGGPDAPADAQPHLISTSDHHEAGKAESKCGSRQVSWWSVHEHVAPALALAGTWPTAGTPAWCDLADDDPVKIAALYDAAQHWALRLDAQQEAHAEASKAVAAALDWPALARKLLQRNSFYAAHPWLKRVTT